NVETIHVTNGGQGFTFVFIVVFCRVVINEIFDVIGCIIWVCHYWKCSIWGCYEVKEEKDKGADIFVTTPERFYEVIDKGYLKIDNLRYAIFEEFDRLLSDLDIEKTIDILNQIRSFSLNSRKNLIICKELSTELQKNFERIRRKNLFITRNNKKNVFGRNILHTIV
uniref:DEAD domain-containing protein n=1 Tax=Strongyloides papillosus TaxID=174720 RepID=A0A0N5BUP0_STREA